MQFLTESYREMTTVISINTDRLLVPLLIVAALFLAGNVLSYATVH